MSNYTLEGIKISTEEFLGALFEANDKICFRVFADKTGSAFQGGLNYEATQGFYYKIAETLREHNEQDRGIFCVVNFGGHADADIKRINAQFMECDKMSHDKQLEKIKAFPIEPSIIVKTRNSLHCYWLIKDGEVKRFRQIQHGLVAHFGADPKCVNESRVFRLPGFNHCKEEPVMIEVIKFNPELRYTQDELQAVLPEVPKEEAPSAVSVVKEQGNQKGLMLCGLRCSFIKHCKKNAKNLPEPDWYAMITNLAVFEGGEAAIHRLSKPYPKYSAKQTQAKINHFHKSGTKPMKCVTIAQNGFVCPKQKSGTCKSKSPAGLAYFPLDKDELRKRLVACVVSGNMLDDIDTVRQFINDYMYNTDIGFADAFINHEIKPKFNLKATDLKPLIVLQKEAHSTFFQTHESKINRQGEELPPWFEFAESGGRITLRFMPSVLADWLAENDPTFYCGEQHYFYEGGVYLPARNDLAAEKYVRSHMKIDKYKTSNQIADAEHQWRMEIDRGTNEINPNAYLLNFANCFYNPLTDEISEHDSKILSTIRLNGNYNPNAECPVFLKYIHDSLPETEIPLIQEMLGYMLIAVNNAQKAFVILGKADSGKSTLLYVVQDVLLGKDNCSNLTWNDLTERFAIVQVFGKLANIFANLPGEKIRDTGVFKAITGEDYITAQHKFKDYFSFKPFVRMLFSCEEMPKNYTDRNGGFYRRLILINFENVINPAKKDRKLRGKLLLEADGILAWSILGLRRLIANDFLFSETDRTRSALRKYRADNSSPLTFVGECCVLDAKSEIKREELYNAFLEFCKDNGGKPVSKTIFNRDLDDMEGLSRGTIAGVRTWRGIRLA